MRRFFALLIAVMMIATMLCIPASATQAANIAAESRNGVVRVIAVTNVTSSYISFSKGSGFAVGPAGEPTSIFITNQHVVEGGLEYYILLDNDWKQSIPTFGGKDDNKHAVKCEIVYVTNGVPDFAILRAEREVTERSAIPLMKSHLATPGDTIFALGYPGVADDIEDNISADVDSVSITRGTLSRFTVMESEHSNAIQIDADINKGNSGGPLITEQGNVIGINTWYWADGDAKICLALDIDYVIEKLTELTENGSLGDFTFTLITELNENVPETEPEKTEPVEESEEPDVPEETEESETETEPEPAPASAVPIELIWLAVIMAGCALAAVLFMKTRAPAPQNAPAVVVAEPKQDVTAPHTAPQNIVYQSSAIEFRLVGMAGEFAGRRIAIDHELRLGRNPNSDLIFPANTPGISTSHCKLNPGTDCVILTDLGSTYGTYLANGTKLTPHQAVSLNTGDCFYLADKRQLFQIDHKRR